MYSPNNYSPTPAGMMMFAWEQWKFFKHYAEIEPSDELRMLYTGRCKAYSEMLELLTGCKISQYKQMLAVMLADMPQGTVGRYLLETEYSTIEGQQ